LHLSATADSVSLQPTSDPANPRIFITLGGLILSVVPTQSSLETDELVGRGRGVYGSIEFPVVGKPFYEGEVYRAVLIHPAGEASPLRAGDSHTKCGACHGIETEVRRAPLGTNPAGVPGYRMDRFLPETMPFDQLVRIANACQAQASVRCEIMRALFRGGCAVPYQFPDDFDTTDE